MAVVALSTQNPFYVTRARDWVRMRDAYAGEERIKEKGVAYLPPTTTMMQDGMSHGQDGLAQYEAYKMRAVYHELVQPSLEALLGIMHRKKADITLTPKLDGLRKRATFDGLTLEQLLVRINEQQMLMGRLGCMLDIKDNAAAGDLPYIVTYNTENCINWDSSKVSSDDGPRRLQFVVLDETGMERTNGFSWQTVMKYRVLCKGDEMQDVFPGIAPGYVAAEVRNSQDAAGAQFFKPTFFGKTLDEIPFQFIGPRDLAAEPDKPLLLPLARLALAIYRTEADYRQALYMQGQDTLVVTGASPQGEDGTQQRRVGAFGSIELPMGGTAEFIGADSNGISDLRTSIDADFRRADQLGAQLLTERGNEAEAAGALNIRVASRTATVTTTACTGAQGLELILKAAAKFVGDDPDKIAVEPNLDFVDDATTAQDITYIMTGKSMGAVLSNKSIHGWLRKHEFTDMDYEDELSEIDNEGPALASKLGRGIVQPPGPVSPAGISPKKPAAPVPKLAPRGAKDAARASGAGPKKT